MSDSDASQQGDTADWQFTDDGQTTADGNGNSYVAQNNDQNAQTDGQQSDPSNNTPAGFTAVQSACQLSALKLHNSLRNRHGVQALTLDDAISQKAQAYAEYLASNNLFEHSTDRNDLGENLYTSSSSQSLVNDDHGEWLKIYFCFRFSVCIRPNRHSVLVRRNQ
jgi:uncharacterized protein YkwD